MRCPNCKHELASNSPPAGTIASCPRCRSSVSSCGIESVDVEPLPPLQTASLKRRSSRQIEAAVVLLIIGVLVALLMTDSRDGRGVSRSGCLSRLKDLARALHVYHDRYQSLPAQCLTDENGRPMHSWRVALLPILEQTKVYNAYDFDQPWNSPHNSALCERYIESFQCPGFSETGDEDLALTHYFVVSGDETMFGPNRWTRFDEVTDGLSNTIMIVECDSPGFRVKWYEPRDIPFDEMEFRLNPPDGLGVSSPHRGGANVALGDGSVRFVANDSVGEPTFRYLLIRNDGMPVQLP